MAEEGTRRITAVWAWVIFVDHTKPWVTIARGDKRRTYDLSRKRWDRLWPCLWSRGRISVSPHAINWHPLR